MIFDGKQAACDVLAHIRACVQSYNPIVVRAVVMDPSPATRSYLKVKEARAKEAGMELEILEVSPLSTVDELQKAVIKKGADAVIVQLPLPAIIDRRTVLDTIELSRDADILSSAAYEKFENDAPDALTPPVVGAIREIFKRTGVSPKDKTVAIVGRGSLVGRPAATWFAEQGARVTVVTRESSADLATVLTDADIVVLGAGVPSLIKKDMVKKGVVLIDAGTSESGGTIVGDAEPECADVASVFTPVPGGIGPLAVAMLFKNVLELVKRRQTK